MCSRNVNTHEQPFQALYLSKSPGLYYENLGITRIHSQTWKLVTYLNTSMLTEKLNILQFVLSQTHTICNDHLLETYPTCVTSLNILKKLVPTIREQDNVLKDLIGHPRNRRGLINGLGKIFKILIGTLDSDDAEYYNNAINDLNVGEKDMTSLLKSQSQVVQSTITNFNGTITNLHHTADILNTNLNMIEKLNQATNKNIHLQEARQNLEDHIDFLTIIIMELNREYSTLINAILFSKQNLLHPSVLTPYQVMKELLKTKNHLPPNTDYPVILSKHTMYQLLNLISVTIYYMDSKLIFLVYVPIVENTIYTLYHLTPLPILNDNKAYVFINPSFEYLALSQNKLSYTSLSSIEKCTNIINKTYICQQENPLYHTYSQENCESQLLTAYPTTPNCCDIRITNIKHEIWYQLKENNKWLFVIPQNTHVTIDCENKNPYEIQLYGTGFFSMEPLCTAYTKNTILKSISEYSSNVVSSYIPNIDVTKDNLMLEKYSELPLIEITPINVPKNLNDLKTASYKLKQIEDIAEQLSHKNNINYKVRFHDIVMSIFGLLMLIFSIYFMYKFILYYKRNEPLQCCTRIMCKTSPSNSEIDVELHNTQNTAYQGILQCTNQIPRPPLAETIPLQSLPCNPSAPSLPPTPTSPRRRSSRLKDRL